MLDGIEALMKASASGEDHDVSNQGELWSADPDGWARGAESRLVALYEAVLELLAPLAGTRLLDAGCGAGLFASLAAERGAEVHGLDAAPAWSSTCGDVCLAPQSPWSATSVRCRSLITTLTSWSRLARCCTRPTRRRRWPSSRV